MIYYLQHGGFYEVGMIIFACLFIVVVLNLVFNPDRP